MPCFPEGLKILEAEQVDLKSPSLSTLIDKTRYRITFDESEAGRLSELCVQFMAHTDFVIQRKKKGEVQSVDLRGEVATLTAAAVERRAGGREGQAAGVRPRDHRAMTPCRPMTSGSKSWKCCSTAPPLP